jgi:hypothetical protein
VGAAAYAPGSRGRQVSDTGNIDPGQIPPWTMPPDLTIGAPLPGYNPFLGPIYSAHPTAPASGVHPLAYDPQAAPAPSLTITQRGPLQGRPIRRGRQ